MSYWGTLSSAPVTPMGIIPGQGGNKCCSLKLPARHQLSSLEWKWWRSVKTADTRLERRWKQGPCGISLTWVQQLEQRCPSSSPEAESVFQTGAVPRSWAQELCSLCSLKASPQHPLGSSLHFRLLSFSNIPHFCDISTLRLLSFSNNPYFCDTPFANLSLEWSLPCCEFLRPGRS